MASQPDTCSFEDLGDFIIEHKSANYTTAPIEDYDLLSEGETNEARTHIHANGLDFKSMLDFQGKHPNHDYRKNTELMKQMRLVFTDGLGRENFSEAVHLR